MAQIRPNTKYKPLLRRNFGIKSKEVSSCDKSLEEILGENKPEDPDSARLQTSQKSPQNTETPSVNNWSKAKADQPDLPHDESTETPSTEHSSMKTKQNKEESDKSIDDDTVVEPKTRARKKATDATEDPKQDEPKQSKETKKPAGKPRAVVKKKPLGIRKALRSKKTVIVKDKIKNVIKQGAKRGRKPNQLKSEPQEDKETVPLIPATEIKKEAIEEPASNSRSSSPKTAGRRPRVSSDMAMLKNVLGDSSSTLVHGPRTSPYSMRSERSNSPSTTDAKNLRSGKPRKLKNNLLNEVVMKEQKKRRRLLSDSKVNDPDDDSKKMKRGRSMSRDGSEISKCSDVTESDISLSEAPNDELKKLDKSKTDIDVNIENSVQISTTEKVPLPDGMPEPKAEVMATLLSIKKRKASLRSTSLDSDNNNSNRVVIETLPCLDLEEKAALLFKGGNAEKELFEERSSILTSMSKTFNSKEVSKNIRKARRGRKVVLTTRTSPGQAKPVATSTVTRESVEDKQETLETLSDEINNLIMNLDQTIEGDSAASSENPSDSISKTPKLLCSSKPLGDNNSITNPETPIKDKEAPPQEDTSSKIDDSENIILHYEEDSQEKIVDETPKTDITYKCSTVASIDLLMDRLKEFEEFDKKRQRQETEGKNDKQVMVSNDVVLIPKSGDIKQLKDMQSVRSPERPLEKENVLSCFENNSAISIVKREHVRKSVDVDLPNSVTLIKRNSISRKASTGSNHSRESTDAISIFEKSLGKDVTLTEIRKSVDRPPVPQVEAHFATLSPNPFGGHGLDSKQISITPRVVEAKSADVKERRKSRSRAASEATEPADKPAEVMRSPPAPPAKPLEAVAMETEPLAPPPDAAKTPEDVPMPAEVASAPAPVTPVAEPPPPEPARVEPKPPVVESEPTPAAVEPVTETPPEAQPDATPKEPTPPVEEEKPARASESEPGPSNILTETPESQKRKENVLRTLGLLTHKAANEAKIEKQKEKERLYGVMINKKKCPADSTGTLKTVIKLNRISSDKKRYRSSLKMTFQKSKNRSAKIGVETGDVGEAEDAYYTIERREAGASSDGGGHRKSYSNRLNHEDPPAEPTADPTKEAPNLVIPEKASSFSIHPGRLCQDQCFYCGGKFGLFDTPCHIAQMKSADRQRKVLANEEKLTIDSCLCDACYRHVDRRANCPSYRARPLKTAATDAADTPSEVKELPPAADDDSDGSPPPRAAACHAAACAAPAAHAIRRKWLIKMRGSVNKLIKLQGDYPGLHTLPLCAEHYRALAPLLACALCRRRLTKHHSVHFVHQGLDTLSALLRAAGVPAALPARPVFCKPCRELCAALQRGAPDAAAAATRRRLLQLYNVEVPPESDGDPEDPSADEARKKKSKTKTKRKSSDLEKMDTEDTEKKMAEYDYKEEDTTNQSLEEDIESLISSNKIPVPNSKAMPNSETSEEGSTAMEGPLIPIDKQTELQYLLQKQNNPAQFLQKPSANLTQKRAKAHAPGVQKPGQQHRIHEKNAKRIQKIGQILTHADKPETQEDRRNSEEDKAMEMLVENLPLSDECTIESVPNKKPADITHLKSKWQMSESFTQVKKNLSELSKKVPAEKVSKKAPEDRQKFSNPVKRLETNPSISVRELFPGEDEMNLQCNIEFNNVKCVTPEGWEKCNTTIQYDVETKRLWHELQNPYGNQSSFLRHLVLLEKYFRSGDLVLSNNATMNAVTYSDAVQNRLRAFDATPSEPRRDLIEFRRQKPSVNGKSLLKSNQMDKEVKKPFMPPPGVIPKPKHKDKSKHKPLPPQLIAINTGNTGTKGIQNVLHNIQQLVKGVSASDPIEVATAPLPETPKEKKEDKREKKDPGRPHHEPHKKKSSSKPWRPTLMPITQDNLSRISREPRQTAVDGRSLPSLVQVMSSGTRYHITLQDYNKMCVMRREKLQQLQQGPVENIVTEVNPAAMLGNGCDDRPELMGSAATILKSVGLKNITIAPIPAKTSTVTSPSAPGPAVAAPGLAALRQLEPAVSVTSEPAPAPPAPPAPAPPAPAGLMIMPKIPKSLTVIPQTVPAAREPRP